MPTHAKSSTVVRMMHGNTNVPRGDPRPKAFSICPEPPAMLRGEARAEWERLAPELHRLGLLTIADVRVFALYCQAYARWCQAEDALFSMAEADPITHGLVSRGEWGMASNPLIRIAANAAKDMHRFAEAFGLTPQSRTRLDGAVELEQAPSKFAGLLKQ